jgi:hypothetical protein
MAAAQNERGTDVLPVLPLSAAGKILKRERHRPFRENRKRRVN